MWNVNESGAGGQYLWLKNLARKLFNEYPLKKCSKRLGENRHDITEI